jgi:hypothetical protein
LAALCFWSLIHQKIKTFWLKIKKNQPVLGHILENANSGIGLKVTPWIDIFEAMAGRPSKPKTVPVSLAEIELLIKRHARAHT